MLDDATQHEGARGEVEHARDRGLKGREPQGPEQLKAPEQLEGPEQLERSRQRDDTRARQGQVSWRQAHAVLQRLAANRAALDLEEGKWLLCARSAGVHARLGFGSFREYIDRLFGYSARLLQEKLRVAEALAHLPGLAGALDRGALSWSGVRELTRVATPENEDEWLRASAGRTARDIERLVAGRKLGDSPSDLVDPAAMRHVIRLEVTGQAFATFRQAMTALRRGAGHPLDDDEAVLLLARAVLRGPEDPGRSSYQIALSICERCRRGRQVAGGELVDVSRDALEMAQCDAQHVARIAPVPIWRELPRRPEDGSTVSMSPASDHGVKGAEASDEGVSGAEASDEGVSGAEANEQGGTRDEATDQRETGSEARDQLLARELVRTNARKGGAKGRIGFDAPSAHVGIAEAGTSTGVRSRSAHVGIAEAGTSTGVRSRSAHAGIAEANVELGFADTLNDMPPRTGGESLQHAKSDQRATQPIPPRVRRFVWHRDGGRCVVPGCRQATFLDVHHLEYRARGGGHGPDNLVTLCSAHHRAVHRGALVAEGQVSTGVRFLHADGRPYGDATSSVARACGDLIGPRRNEDILEKGGREGVEADAGGSPGRTRGQHADRSRTPTDARVCVLRALAALGFSARHAQTAVERVRTEENGTAASALLRDALRYLTPAIVSVS